MDDNTTQPTGDVTVTPAPIEVGATPTGPQTSDAVSVPEVQPQRTPTDVVVVDTTGQGPLTDPTTPPTADENIEPLPVDEADVANEPTPPTPSTDLPGNPPSDISVNEGGPITPQNFGTEEAPIYKDIEGHFVQPDGTPVINYGTADEPVFQAPPGNVVTAEVEFKAESIGATVPDPEQVVTDNLRNCADLIRRAAMEATAAAVNPAVMDDDVVELANAICELLSAYSNLGEQGLGTVLSIAAPGDPHRNYRCVVAGPISETVAAAGLVQALATEEVIASRGRFISLDAARAMATRMGVQTPQGIGEAQP